MGRHRPPRMASDIMSKSIIPDYDARSRNCLGGVKTGAQHMGIV